MFTGIVEAMGELSRVEAQAEGRRLWVRAREVAMDLARGDSVALDGCCLTVVALEAPDFAVDVVPETLSRTTLGGWRAGQAVNLERAMRLDQRLGGHLVQGHVDGVGTVRAVAREGQGRRMTLEIPAALSRFVAEKGSLAVDGVSLTVASCAGERCEIALIPHTLEVTVAGSYAPGRKVNLEVDLIARYIARMLEASGSAGRDT